MVFMKMSFQNVRGLSLAGQAAWRKRPLCSGPERFTGTQGAPLAPSVLWQTKYASSSSEKWQVIGPFA
jgi:hypothetical protein